MTKKLHSQNNQLIGNNSKMRHVKTQKAGKVDRQQKMMEAAQSNYQFSKPIHKHIVILRSIILRKARFDFL